MLQRHAVQKLHGDERFAMLVVNLIDCADIGMIQRRGSLGFALKAAECLRVFGYVIGQELDGNKPAKLDIFGFVDHTHAAATELLDDAVVRDGLAMQFNVIISYIDLLPNQYFAMNSQARRHLVVDFSSLVWYIEVVLEGWGRNRWQAL
jgi:hypothetical protein